MNGLRIRPSERFIRAYSAEPWAIHEAKMDEILAMTEALMAGGIRAEDVARVKAAAPSMVRSGSVAVLPLFGTIFPRGGMFSEMSGGTSAEKFGAQFSALVNDPSVSAIVIDVDSPGGQVAGVPELADRIFAARGSKPIVAVANHLMASAAYWVGSAASEIVAAPSATVGSIGVLMAHVDETAAAEKAGLKVTLISAGKEKTVGHPLQSLSEDGLARLQGQVDDAYGSFVGAVARHRGVKSADVRGGFGQGYVVSAAEAKRQGMVDRVATMEETIARLLKSQSRTNAARATRAAIGIRSATSAEERETR